MPASIAVVPMNQSSVEKNGLGAADGHQVAAGRRAGELDRGRGHVRAVLGELDHVGPRHLLEELLGGAQLHRTAG